ncbi:MAG: PAS domain S-box protein, partial [Allorhizobium sp.]
MQTMTWNAMPSWALLASRDILKAALPERRLGETLKDILSIITGLPQLDLSEMAAIYVRDAGQDRQRLVHHNTADQLDLPIDLAPGARMPECIADRDDLIPYWIAITVNGDPDFGTAVFFSRSERPINTESLSALRLLAQEIGPVIQQRNGCTTSVLDMVELSTDEIYIFEPQRFTISRTNATASVRTGYSAEALAGMTPASLKVGISELDYRAKLMPLVEGSARSVTFDAIQRRRNGTVYPVKVHVWRIRGPSSDLFAEVAIATADQRKAFGLLEQVFDAIPGGIGVFDNRSRLLMANRRLYDLMNIPPELFPPGS